MPSINKKILLTFQLLDDEAKLRAEFDQKKAKFLQLIETGSRHQDLVAFAEQEAEDSYFSNMETKEKIEDKMLNTHKVEAKAVQCTQVQQALNLQLICSENFDKKCKNSVLDLRR